MNYIAQYESLTNEKLGNLKNIEHIKQHLLEKGRVKIPLPLIIENNKENVQFGLEITKTQDWYLFSITNIWNANLEYENLKQFIIFWFKNILKQVFEKFSFETWYNIKSKIDNSNNLLFYTQDMDFISNMIIIFYNNMNFNNIKLVKVDSDYETSYSNPSYRDPMSYN